MGVDGAGDGLGGLGEGGQQRCDEQAAPHWCASGHSRTLLALVAAVLLALALPAYGQDWQKGLDAYNSGDYATALRGWRPLAEQGNAYAQVNLGYMYENSRRRRTEMPHAPPPCAFSSSYQLEVGS